MSTLTYPMTLMIPMFRGQLKHLQTQRSFEEPRKLQKEPLENSPKNMVIVHYRHVPIMKRFRHGKEWWKKETPFCAVNTDTLHRFDFNPFDEVGVFLKDLREEDRKYIIP